MVKEIMAKPKMRRNVVLYDGKEKLEFIEAKLKVEVFPAYPP